MTRAASSAAAPTRRPVRFVDTSLRDGNQSLWAAAGLTTGMVEAVGAALDRAGFAAIDFTSSTHLLMGVKCHRENPWERIARMRQAVAATPLSAITTGMRFMSWEKASEPVMRLALRLMAENGLSRLQIADPMNDIEASLRVAQWARQEGIRHTVVAVTFTESPVHTDARYSQAAAAYAESPLVDALYLKDPGGLLTVDRARSLIPEIRRKAGSKTFELHGHCTTGAAPEIYLVAAQLGVDVLHTGLGPLSNGTAQPSLERLLDNFEVLGIPCEIDRAAAAEAARLLADIAARQGLPAGAPVEFDLRPHGHQIPGGMMATLKRQLAEIGLADQLGAVQEETGRVRAELGYPIMVTPFSQFVCSQALMNVLAVRAGKSRWSTVPDEVIRYVLGQFGTPEGEIDADVLDRVCALPRARELDAAGERQDIEAFRARQEAALKRCLDDGELLMRMLLPTDQVDAVLAAGAAPRWHPASPPGREAVRTIADFAREVHKLPRWRSLYLRRGDQTLALDRGGGTVMTSTRKDTTGT